MKKHISKFYNRMNINRNCTAEYRSTVPCYRPNFQNCPILIVPNVVCFFYMHLTALGVLFQIIQKFKGPHVPFRSTDLYIYVEKHRDTAHCKSVGSKIETCFTEIAFNSVENEF